MAVLILGLVVFLGAHSFTTFREARASLVARIGEGPYKGLYALASLAGLVLIVIGYGQYRANGYIQVWDPPTGLRHLTLLLMWFAFVALVAAYSPGAIKTRLKHPMLVAVKIWALAHLLANGDLGSMILFGAFLAWAVYDRISVKRRPGADPAGSLSFGRGDVIALLVGTIAYFAMISLHPLLIGVSVMG
jgi:uncharacterized membrane protein